MHTHSAAIESLEIIWRNYLTVCERVDLDACSPEQLEHYAQSPIRPFRIAAFHSRQGAFIAMWNLWEYYSRSLCGELPNKERQLKSESTVNWIGRSLASNNKPFSELNWFVQANSLRNLIAHNGARIDSGRTESQFKKASLAFDNLDTFSDGYLTLESSHVAELKVKIESFIRETTNYIVSE
ncbi:hypothetical protein [Rhodopirellula bahusiensis]